MVDRPDVRGRVEILKVHTGTKIPLAPDVDLGVIARSTPGFSGADLANLCNEAALLAARQGKDSVSMADFESSKDKVFLGSERRSMVMTEEDKAVTRLARIGTRDRRLVHGGSGSRPQDHDHPPRARTGTYLAAS